jgi:hypothetical protein
MQRRVLVMSLTIVRVAITIRPSTTNFRGFWDDLRNDFSTTAQIGQFVVRVWPMEEKICVDQSPEFWKKKFLQAMADLDKAQVPPPIPRTQ